MLILYMGYPAILHSCSSFRGGFDIFSAGLDRLVKSIGYWMLGLVALRVLETHTKAFFRWIFDQFWGFLLGSHAPSDSGSAWEITWQVLRRARGGGWYHPRRLSERCGSGCHVANSNSNVRYHWDIWNYLKDENYENDEIDERLLWKLSFLGAATESVHCRHWIREWPGLGDTGGGIVALLLCLGVKLATLWYTFTGCELENHHLKYGLTNYSWPFSIEFFWMFFSEGTSEESIRFCLSTVTFYGYGSSAANGRKPGIMFETTWRFSLRSFLRTIAFSRGRKKPASSPLMVV